MSADELREKTGPYGYVAGEGFTTCMLHHGHKLDTDNRARAVPIFQSTSFCFKNAEHGANLFGLKELGPIYSRLMNPTVHCLEYKVAKLEGAPCTTHGDFDNAKTLPASLATSTGLSAQMHALLTIMRVGDNFLCGNELYGGSFSQMKYSFAQIGIEARFVEMTKPETFEKLIDDRTKCIYIEAIANPSYNVPDFDAISAIAKKHVLPLVVDNTFGMCGYVCRPLKFGANIVVESATKWLGGHGTTMGGMITDGQNFDWSVKKADGTFKFPEIADNQPSYHGASFLEHPVFGVKASNTIFILLARLKTMRDLGGSQAPMNAFQLIQGIETLALRGKAHCENTNRLAAYLDKHPLVKAVVHPSLPNHPSHERAKKYLRKGCFGAVLCVELKGANAEQERLMGQTLIDKLKLASNLANVGDSRTLVIHPASTTHEQLSPEEQAAAGVNPGSVRVSVGYEEYEDIEGDFAQALEACAAVIAKM